MLMHVKAGDPAFSSLILQSDDQSHWGTVTSTADGMYFIMQTRL